jgi:hypothetical protein
MHAVAAFRSWLGRLEDSQRDRLGAPAPRRLLDWLSPRMLRFRYLGDYYFAYRRGWIDVFSDSSAIYAQLHNGHGLPTLFAPWGAAPEDYADLGLERDIDVLWMGLRATHRRSSRLDRIRQELARHGVNMYVADGVENPFIYGKKRMHLLNRSKITLNLTRTWYDDNFSRFSMAAPNRSLFVSEPLLPHCPPCRPGEHYVSVPVEEMADTILFYLTHEAERRRFVEQAYQLCTNQLAFSHSIRMMMDAVACVREQPSRASASEYEKARLATSTYGHT